MGYYLRYIVTDGDLRLEEIEQALHGADEAYRLQAHAGPRDRSADLYHGEQLYAEVEVNRPGDDLFEDEIAELREAIEGIDDEGADSVSRVLGEATAILAVRALWQGRGAEATLTRLDPLWVWLHEHREGLLQADGEGYHDADGVVLALD